MGVPICDVCNIVYAYGISTATLAGVDCPFKNKPEELQEGCALRLPLRAPVYAPIIAGSRSEVEVGVKLGLEMSAGSIIVRAADLT